MAAIIWAMNQATWGVGGLVSIGGPATISDGSDDAATLTGSIE